MDTSELEAAYRTVLELATAAAPDPGSRPDLPAGGTERAADGSGQAWRAQDVLAHLVLNDRLLARAVRSVLEGAAQPYDNAAAVDLADLRGLGERVGGTAGLIGALEASSRELLELAGRLDQAQGDTPLPARIVDGGEVFLDRPVPVAELLGIQARAHLPMHWRQLSELLGRP
jgi:hypothetical protein